MKKLSTVSTLFILLALCNRANAHDIHISYSQAELKGNELFVRVSYYKDDFTKAVKNWYQGKADNFSNEQFQSAEFEYVKNYYRLWTDADLKHQVMPKLLNVSDNGTSIIFEIQFSCVETHSITIDQRVLFKEYNDEMNIFFIKSSGKEANHIFTPSKPTFLFKS